MTVTRAEVRAILAVADAIVDAVRATGTAGAPAGHLYAIMMAHCTLDQFNQFMDLLVRTHRITKVGHVYYAKEEPCSSAQQG
jgi:hypothetical protein